jgi:hypothetical protein
LFRRTEIAALKWHYLSSTNWYFFFWMDAEIR